MFEARASREGISVAEAEAQMAAGNSVRRVIDAEDIASVVAFLASPKSSAINGDIIAAGGGDPGVIHY
jgi:enoyl-[acyl-carrier-protein] reductase (NADH)